MSSFKNKQGISHIKMKGKFECYCPLGKAPYTGHLSIHVWTPKRIPDYCDVDKFIAEKVNGHDLIIEDAVIKVLDFMADQIKHGEVEVKCKVNDAAHSPVVVSKWANVEKGKYEVNC